jgi:hypothetical protein
MDGGVVIDACTLNNALNVVQIAILVALLRWVRQGAPGAERRPGE